MTIFTGQIDLNTYLILLLIGTSLFSTWMSVLALTRKPKIPATETHQSKPNPKNNKNRNKQKKTTKGPEKSAKDEPTVFL